MARDPAPDDERLMRECLRLAARGAGQVSPNPMVGALLVRRGKIVARGYHRRYGGPHAERECLAAYRGNPRGLTMVVNLEPCSHHGKTPPCVDALLEAGIAEVVVGTVDPNPLVAGRGIRRLRAHGVRVRTGVLAGECRAFNRFFFRHVRTHRPYVHVKIAQSADGFIAPPRGRRVWISSTASRRLVHEWRALYDAVLVGAGTVKADDPFLTVRSTPGRNPHAVILDGGFSVPKAARLFKTRSGRRVIVVTTSSALGRKRSKAVELAARGVEVLGIRTRSKRIPFDLLLRVLYGERIGSLLVEGGAEVFGQVLRERAADEISTFIAPRELGEGVAVAHPRHGGVGRRRTGGKDVRVTARMSGVDLLISARRR